MQLLRAYKFRIYPDMKRQKEIDKRLILAQQLYNNILEETKKEYKKDEKSKINKSTLNKYMKEAVSGVASTVMEVSVQEMKIHCKTTSKGRTYLDAEDKIVRKKNLCNNDT